MKRIISAVAVAVLCTGIQAQAEDAPIVVPSQWTHADRNPVKAGLGDAFPGSAPDMIVLTASSTRADRYAGEIAKEAPVSAFAGSAPEMIVLESQWTRADRFTAGDTLASGG